MTVVNKITFFNFVLYRVLRGDFKRFFFLLSVFRDNVSTVSVYQSNGVHMIYSEI